MNFTMKTFISIIIAAVVIVIGVGLYLSGSPNQERIRRFDDIRLQHLQNIQQSLINYWEAKRDLPVKLSDITVPVSGGEIMPVDPATGVQYEYNRKTETLFTLCANFGAESRDYDNNYGGKIAQPYPVLSYPMGPILGDQNWSHKAGRVCFERAIDPDFFAIKDSPVSDVKSIK
jgi:hypothetical protein